MSTREDQSSVDRSWRALYVSGAIVAFAGVAGMLFDIVLTMVPLLGPGTVPNSAPAWFAQFSDTPLLALRNLDLLNITLSAIGLPMYLAIAGAHRRSEPALALAGLVFVTLGTALFIANNAALPMLELSRHYAGATSSAERAALEAAALALLARGAHGSYGAFTGFFISEVGTLLTAVAMVRGRLFGRVTAWAGLAGTAVLTIYSVAITVAPHATWLMSAVAAPAGLVMLGWSIAVGIRLLRLAREA